MARPAAVLWVYQLIRGRDGVRLEGGQQPSLCLRGRKHMLCVTAGHPVRVLKRDASDFDKLRKVRKGEVEYPVVDAIAKFRDIGERNGITQGALKLLALAEEWLASTASDVQLDNEDEFENEEETTMTENVNPTESTTTNTEKETANVTKSKKTATKKAKAPKVKRMAAPKAKKVPKAKGPTPFRPGTAKEKAFIEYKAHRKEYEALEHGAKKEWAQKLAKRLDLSPATVSSWIGGQFKKALG